MGNSKTIIFHELKKYLTSLTGYVYIVIFLIASSLIFWQETFLVGQASMRVFFATVPWLFALLLPALTMKIWSEEQKEGTIEVLLTQPIQISKLIIGKWLAATLFITIIMVFSLPIPIILSTLGPVDIGQIVGGYIGMIIIGASFIAIGSFISTLSKNQVVAFIITVIVIGIFLGTGANNIATQNPDINNVLLQISITGHYDKFVRGIIDSRDVTYFIAIITVSLYLSSLSIRKKRT